jgi:flavin-dependent dehydrogenase
MAIPEYRDIVVVGAGPAGLAAAIAARQKGLSVAVLDPARPPIEKACGEGLMPDGVQALEQLGVGVENIESYRFRGIRFLSRDVEAGAAFPTGFGLGIRRTTFHSALAAHAATTGVDLVWGIGATGLTPDAVLTSAGNVRCQWTVGADGGHSRVRRWAGLDRSRSGLGAVSRFGFRRHHAISPWSDHVEVHWGDACQIYVTPVSTAQVCVALVSRDSRLRLDDALPGFPILQSRLRNAGTGTLERGAITASRSIRRVARGRVALIGDASGTVDAITGEGLCLAFRQALALAGALAAGDLESYARAHARIVRQTRMMARLLLLLDRRAWLRHRTLETLAANPGLFRQLLAAHVRSVTPLELLRAGLALGLRFIAP